MDRPDIFSEMAARWPSAVVARSKIDQFTGGLLSPKTIANLDSAGEGPPVRVEVYGHIGYPVESFTKWLRTRSIGRIQGTQK